MAKKQLIHLLISYVWILSALGFPTQQILSAHEHFGTLRRFRFENDESLQYILKVTQDDDLDVWQVTNSHVDIYTPKVPHLLQHLPYSESIIDASIPIKTSSSQWNLSSLENSNFHSSYHPLYEVEAFLSEIAELHPNIVQINRIGHSGEGREILGVTLSNKGVQANGRRNTKKKVPPQDLEKLGIVVVGAQHAREWIATATALYLVHAIVADALNSRSLSPLLDHFDFHIIPVPNPDGYDYTWETDRFWYKNRQVIGPRAKCVGIDLNRNWGYKWKPIAEDTGPIQGDGNLKLSGLKQPTDPCSHWYPGSRPFQAPEVNSVANFVSTLPNLVAFFDLRSYGQMLSFPYSYTSTRLPRDAENQFEAALGAAQAIGKAHGTMFKAGSLCSMLYRAPGNILDWMYARAGIEYSYVAHLRDTGTYGFSLPEKWIRPVGEETRNMIDYVARFIAKKRRREL